MCTKQSNDYIGVELALVAPKMLGYIDDGSMFLLTHGQGAFESYSKNLIPKPIM